MSAGKRRTVPRPGQPNDARTPDDIAAMIRVDHAGEAAAVRIYQGQLAVLGDGPVARRSSDLVRHMAAQEQVHLDTFNRIMRERGVRPTAMAPLWDLASYALGAVTALMGEKAAMACTEAVEEVIDAHYAAQQERLKGRDSELETVVEKFRAEEIEHRDTARAEGAKEAPAYPVLTGLIKAGCRTAIRISEKI